MVAQFNSFKVRTASLVGLNRRGFLAGALGIGVVPLLSGCIKSFETIGKSADSEEKDRYGIRTVGEVTSVGNADPVPLGGVGLVTDLGNRPMT